MTGPKIFNKKSRITKIDFYETLRECPFLKKHIPKTRLFRKSSDLTGFLQKYDEVFLKPVNSMKGKGIVVVKGATEGLFECRYLKKSEYCTRLIEANGNPGKIPVFMKTKYPLWWYQVYQYPLAYPTYLAGFGDR